MDQATPALTVIYARTVGLELQEIWDYNLEQYQSADHATEYVAFLFDQMEKLSTNYLDGRRVSTRPELRFITMRRRTGGHGHIAVYQVDLGAKTVTVAHVFHTRQNWEERLRKEQRRKQAGKRPKEGS